MNPQAQGGRADVPPFPPTPLVVAIVPPPNFPPSEHSILRRMRGHRLLDKLRCAALSQRPTRFSGDLATIVSALSMACSDIFYRLLNQQSISVVQQRHRAALQAIEVLYELCSNPQILMQWGFSQTQIQLTIDRLGTFIGTTSLQQCPPEPPGSRQKAACFQRSDEAPFLASLLFLLLNKNFPLLALATSLSRARYGFWSADRRIFFSNLDSSQTLLRWAVLTRPAQDIGVVHITFAGSTFDSFRFQEPWPDARYRPRAQFMDPRIRLPQLPNGIFKTPESSDSLIRSKPHWYRYFGNDLAAELETILDGHYCVAKTGLPIRPIWLPNHPSWNEAAQKTLLPVVASWLSAGSLEYCERHHRLPHCILPCGAVSKNSMPFLRLITDARKINIFAESWRVKYTTISQICLMLGPCAIFWIRDLSNAYHLVRLAGCRGDTREIVRWITNADGTGYERQFVLQSGCSPADCLGFCDKSLFGISIADHVLRLAVTQYGHKTSHGPLSVLTDAVCVYASRHHNIAAEAYVDDFIMALSVPPHPFCLGLERNCPICVTAAHAAPSKMLAMDTMMQDCALEFSKKGTLSFGQLGTYLGIVIDTVKGRLFIAPEKFQKLMAHLLELIQVTAISPRGMAKFRGQLGHQLRCLEGLAPLIVPFHRFIGGPDSVYEWDKEKDIQQPLRETMGFLFTWLPQLQPLGAEMWPLDPHTVYYNWTQGISTPGGPLIVLTWDSSLHGVAIAIRTDPLKIWKVAGMRFPGVTTIATLEQESDVQAHREAAGAPMAFHLLTSIVNISGRRVLFRNDCLPVVIAMRKGSPSSTLQAASEVITKGCIQAGAKTLFLHVPGTQLIAEGVDGGSRRGAMRLTGPAITLAAKAIILDLLHAYGWEVTLDLFAARSNRFTDRFVSWTDEPTSEWVDAFTLPSWDQSLCPCGQIHREISFIFPPRGLERTIIRRAISDGIKAVFVVPTNHRADYWKTLRSRALAVGELNDPPSHFACVQAPLGNHTIFLVDFKGSDFAIPACGQECFERGRRQLYNATEAEELSLLHAEQSRLRHLC